MRSTLCEDAFRLGRMLVHFLPNKPEVHGLFALMELNTSHSAARVGRMLKPSYCLTRTDPGGIISKFSGDWQRSNVRSRWVAVVRGTMPSKQQSPHAMGELGRGGNSVGNNCAFL